MTENPISLIDREKQAIDRLFDRLEAPGNEFDFKTVDELKKKMDSHVAKRMRLLGRKGDHR